MFKLFVLDSDFDLSIFDYLDKKIVEFFESNKNNLNACEFLIPEIMSEANNEKFANVKVLETNATWYGVTYKEDTEYVRTSIQQMVDNNEYPNDLWG